MTGRGPLVHQVLNLLQHVSRGLVRSPVEVVYALLHPDDALTRDDGLGLCALPLRSYFTSGGHPVTCAQAPTTMGNRQSPWLVINFAPLRFDQGRWCRWSVHYRSTSCSASSSVESRTVRRRRAWRS